MSGWSEEETKQDKRTEKVTAETASSAEVRLVYNLHILDRSPCVMIAKGTRSYIDEEDSSRLLAVGNNWNAVLRMGWKIWEWQ